MWQPIETAPRDKRILIWANHTIVGGWDEFERCWCGCGIGLMRAYPPNFWQPLPDKPTIGTSRP